MITVIFPQKAAVTDIFTSGVTPLFLLHDFWDQENLLWYPLLQHLSYKLWDYCSSCHRRRNRSKSPSEIPLDDNKATLSSRSVTSWSLLLPSGSMQIDRCQWESPEGRTKTPPKILSKNKDENSRAGNGQPENRRWRSDWKPSWRSSSLFVSRWYSRTRTTNFSFQCPQGIGNLLVNVRKPTRSDIHFMYFYSLWHFCDQNQAKGSLIPGRRHPKSSKCKDFYDTDAKRSKEGFTGCPSLMGMILF